MIRRIAVGDDSALAAVYDRYAPLVYGIARRLVGPTVAADVCQEVFAALWADPERFDADRGALSTFLATLAHRRSIDVEIRPGGDRSLADDLVRAAQAIAV